jgi:hypothetical protein
VRAAESRAAPVQPAGLREAWDALSPDVQRSIVNNYLARRFSGPEGDAAVEERKLLAGKVWKCVVCGKEVRGEDLVIHPRNNYFYHEKSSGEICGRYEEVAAQPPQQGETPKEGKG